jgi:phospho-N-acetylmuramoyl-pentapeptide-transferase
MLLWLLSICSPPGNVDWSDALKTTTRAGLAAGISFLLALVLGPRLIGWLKARFREPLCHDSPRLEQLHRQKQSTPTMGGLFLVAALILALLAFGNLASSITHLVLLLIVGLAMIGAWDDLTKLRSGRRGISPRAKLAGQAGVALVVALLAWRYEQSIPGGLDRAWPLFSDPIHLGLWFIPLAITVIVGMSNAVNLTDGLDGLAGGCLISASVAMGIIAYAGGHASLAEYLHLPRSPGAHELLVVVGSLTGAVLGFLWFNCHPAQVFMGDTGSLPLGGVLGLIAVLTRQELILLLVGGVFVAEAVSVMLQVGSFKLRRKRVFLCAPLHHHFQFAGWPESKIVVRFWIAAALCSLAGVGMLRWSTPRYDDSPSAPTAQRIEFPSGSQASFPVRTIRP